MNYIHFYCKAEKIEEKKKLLCSKWNFCVCISRDVLVLCNCVKCMWHCKVSSYNLQADRQTDKRTKRNRCFCNDVQLIVHSPCAHQQRFQNWKLFYFFAAFEIIFAKVNRGKLQAYTYFVVLTKICWKDNRIIGKCVCIACFLHNLCNITFILLF